MMRLMLSLIVVAAVAGAAVAQPSFAKQGAKGPPAAKEHPGKKAPKAKKETDALAKGVFNALEKRLIGDYFRTRRAKAAKGKSKRFPPGLAKKPLPPGLAMQYRRYGKLPPGLQKRDLPHDLASRMSKLPPGHARVIVGDDVLLIEVATGVILDVLEGVLRK